MKDTWKVKSKGMEKIFHENGNEKKREAGIATPISHNID